MTPPIIVIARSETTKQSKKKFFLLNLKLKIVLAQASMTITKTVISFINDIKEEVNFSRSQ